MEQSAIYSCIDFLLELSRVNTRDRDLLIQYMSRERLEAVAEVIRFILRGSIRPSRQDALLFNESSLVLRQISNSRLGWHRRRRTLFLHRTLVPRFLRFEYLQRALALSFRSHEQ